MPSLFLQVRVVEADSESLEEKYVAELLTSGVRILHLIRVRVLIRVNLHLCVRGPCQSTHVC